MHFGHKVKTYSNGFLLEYSNGIIKSPRLKNDLNNPVKYYWKIYYYVGDDLTDSDGSKSVKQLFPIRVENNIYDDIIPDTHDADGNPAFSMEQYTLFYRKAIDQINSLGLGLRWIYNGWAETTVKNLMHKMDKEGNSTVFYAQRGQTNCITMEKGFGIYYALKNSMNSSLDVMRHEVFHAMGITHKDAPNEFFKKKGETSKINLGFTGIAGMPVFTGFHVMGETTEDTMSGLWSMYGKESSVSIRTRRIYGNIKATNETKKYFFDGFAEAYICYSKTKSIIMQTPIDTTGYFEFNVPLINKLLRKGEYYVLFVSGEFNGLLINNDLIDKPSLRIITENGHDDDGTIKYNFDFDFNKNGHIYYIFKKIPDEQDYYPNIDFKKIMKAKSIKDMGTDLQIHLQYRNQHSHDYTLLAFGTDKNTYVCIKTHVAEAANRPISGANWPNFWAFRSSGEILDIAEKWKPGKTYKSIFKNIS